MFIYETSNRQWKKIVEILGKEPTVFYQGVFNSKKNVIEISQREYNDLVEHWPSYMAKLRIAKKVDRDSINKVWSN